MATLRTAAWWVLSLAMCLVCPVLAVMTMDLGDEDDDTDRGDYFAEKVVPTTYADHDR